MKKIASAIAVSSAVLLAGCAQQDDMPSAAQPADQGQQQVDVQDIKVDGQDQKDQATQEDAQHDPSAKVNMAYSNGSVHATITTNWDGAPQNSLMFRWVAPAPCGTTAFWVKKYKDDNDVTTASHETAYTDKDGQMHICPGKWEGQVIDRNQQKVIATGEVDVSKSQIQSDHGTNHSDEHEKQSDSSDSSSNS